MAPLGFIILLLTIGFRYNNWTLSLVIFLFSGIFAGLLAQSDIEAIKKDWNNRRCDLSVLILAQLFKPADDPRTGGEFAAENFNFCTRSIMIQFIQVLLKPVYLLLNQQVNVVESLNDTFNRLRLIQAEFFKGFQKILDPFFKRFQSTGSEFGVTYQKFLSAMGRAFGITQAFLYIGMSLVLAVENFVHFVINVIMIIMYIILGLMVLIWYLILPVFGLIIFTCQTIGNSSFGYLSKDVCGELCFDPQTKVRLKNGQVKSIQDCIMGDVFADGTVIEGKLIVNGEHEPMFVLDGIRVSGAHLVWCEEKEEWIAVAHHPSASLSLQGCSRLICLRTSNRTIPLMGLQKEWCFRDWEELPLDIPVSDAIWDSLVSQILNKKAPTQSTPSSVPLFDSSCEVMFKTGELRRLAEVKIGDVVYSSAGFTTVTGIYEGEGDFYEGDPYTDGVWLKSFGETSWIHPSCATQNEIKTRKGIHFTTESGCFWIQTNKFSGFTRDFTEVGTKNLYLTYSYTSKLLKKSFNREESCVSDSLLQAS